MKWTKPPLEAEEGEFARVADTFNVDVALMTSLFNEGEIEVLNDATWQNLTNTDSYQNLKIREVLSISKFYGRKRLKKSLRVLWAFLCDKYMHDVKMQTPIVLCFKDGTSHLVSGNTRLMYSKAFGIRPWILKIQLP